MQRVFDDNASSIYAAEAVERDVWLRSALGTEDDSTPQIHFRTIT